MTISPIIRRAEDEIFATVPGAQHSTEVRVGEFAADVAAVAETLPDANHLINLISDRYAFTVTFFAACCRGITTHLPAQRDRASVQALVDRTGAELIGDDERIDLTPGSNGVLNPGHRDLQVANDHVAAIVSTSGSTGQPVAHPKSWGLLDSFRHLHAEILAESHSGTAATMLIATVPSWHMYGLEWALLLPTVAPLALHCGPDFYPNDVAQALAGHAQSAVLVSTPVHLNALLRSTTAAPNVAVTLSATAPIDAAFAGSVEAHLGGRLLEIYGCSEIGSLAQRFTAQQALWSFFKAFTITDQDDRIEVSHDLLPSPVVLADQFRRHGPGFELIGRATDTVKVGGKRDSLARLNVVLQGLPGVSDGLFFDPPRFGLPETGRLGAIVVLDGTNPGAIRQQLSQALDPAFVPRPIRAVDALPRSASGKLQHAALEAILHELLIDGPTT